MNFASCPSSENGTKFCAYSLTLYEARAFSSQADSYAKSLILTSRVECIDADKMCDGIVDLKTVKEKGKGGGQRNLYPCTGNETDFSEHVKIIDEVSCSERHDALRLVITVICATAAILSLVISVFAAKGDLAATWHCL